MDNSFYTLLFRISKATENYPPDVIRVPVQPLKGNAE
jgi:hypothetical protein